MTRRPSVGSGELPPGRTNDRKRRSTVPGDDEGADDYGWQTLRIALATQLLVAVVIFALAGPIARAEDAGD